MRSLTPNPPRPHQKRLLSYERFRSRVIIDGKSIVFEELAVSDVEQRHHLIVENSEGWTGPDISKVYPSHAPSRALAEPQDMQRRSRSFAVQILP